MPRPPGRGMQRISVRSSLSVHGAGIPAMQETAEAGQASVRKHGGIRAVRCSQDPGEKSCCRETAQILIRPEACGNLFFWYNTL